MLPLLFSLKGLTKQQTYTADNHVFRLHYRFTVGILSVFSLIVTYNQFFGDPISCTKTGSKTADDDILEDFCWADSTYSSLDAFDKPRGKDVVYPGVGRDKKETDIVYHKYYQWVCFFLALQAMMFYIPRYIWKALEGDRIKNLTMGLNKPAVFQDDVRKKQNMLVSYFKLHRGLHQKYTYSYVSCEVLNLVNVVGQIFLVDAFLGGHFTRFGLRVIEHAYQEPGDITDPMVRLFPRLCKCKFFLRGPSGDLSDHYVFCVLPMNIINEKIFIFLWFWLVALIAITCLSLAYRLVVFPCSSMRTALLKARCPTAYEQDVQKVTSTLPVGDWFVMYQLAKNVEQIYMREILHDLAEELDVEQNSWTSSRQRNRDNYARSKEDLV